MTSPETAADRVYLDNAATSWPKPESVYAAVDYYQRAVGAAAGRGVYQEAEQAAGIVRAARQAIAGLLGVRQPRHIIFALNGTDALNLALHGTLRPGDHIITTVAEHNSVLRPLATLEREGRITVSYLRCDAAGFIDPTDVRRAWRPETRMVALIHASNVTGAIQPAAEVGRIVCERGGVFLLDAAQTLGHIPVNVEELNVDLLAAPGHKGLLGPLGTGMLYVRPGFERSLRSVRQGGTGTRSQEDSQPDELPDKYEAGNLNVPGIAGLAAGVEHLVERGVESIAAQEQALGERLLAGLGQLSEVKLYGPSGRDHRLGVVSFTVEGYDPQEAAIVLDAAHRVQARAGLHCAPRMHESLGTLTGGTLRLSVGPFTTAENVDRAVAAIAALTGDR